MCLPSIGLTSQSYTDCREITQNNGHYAVQSNSKLSIFVPMESPYATFC